MMLGFPAVTTQPEECVGKGFEYVEIDMTANPIKSFTPERIQQLRETAQRTSTQLGLHTASITLAEPVEALQKGQIVYMMQLIELANQVRASQLVFHGGTYFCPADSIDFEQKAYERVKESIRKLSPVAQEHGVQLVVENSMFYDSEIRSIGDTSDSIALLLDIPDLGFCLDIGHAQHPDVFWNRFQDRIVALHLHSNDGKHDSHQFPQLTAEWQERICSFQGPVVIEVFHKTPEEVLRQW